MECPLLEATAPNTPNGWLRDMPARQLSVLVTAALTIANLASVKNDGELAFRFAIIKATGILLSIGYGSAAISGCLPSAHLAPMIDV
jgi:AAT family amino acid transporter/GABA permease